MLSPVSTIARELARNPGDKLNIGTFVCHERFDPNLAKTGHNFYAFPGKEVRQWNFQYSPLPENYKLLSQPRLPPDVHLDCFIVGNGAVHIPLAQEIMGHANVPIINVHHVLPPPGIPTENLRKIKEHFAPMVWKNVFITEYNRAIWQYEPDEGEVIYHGIDAMMFKPSLPERERGNYALTVTNDFINRGWAVGFPLWQQVADGLPVKVVGNTPGLSQAAPNIVSLIEEYRAASIYFNPSLHSPIPMSLLEAAACGCAIVTTANCGTPLFFEHEKTALMSNDPKRLKSYIQHLIDNPDVANELGRAARECVMEKCDMGRFTNEWNNLLETV